MGNLFRWAPVSSLALRVVFLLSLYARFTSIDTMLHLDSGVPCVKFATVTDLKTMDSKDVSAVESLESSMA